MRITRREKTLIALACLFCLAIFAWDFYLSGKLDRSRTLARRIQERREALQQIRQKAAALRSHEARVRRIKERFAGRKDGFSFLSFLDQNAKASGLRSQMTQTTGPLSDTYSVQTVKIEFSGVPLKQLMDYLYRIESSADLTGIRLLTISTSRRSPSLLDAVIQATTLVREDAAAGSAGRGAEH